MNVTGSESYVTLYEYNENNCLLVEEKTTGEVVETFYYTYDYSGRQIHRQWQKEEPWDEELDQGHIGEDPRRRCIGFVGENFHEDVVTLERKEYNGFGKLTWVYRDMVQSVYTYRPDGLRHEKVVSTLKASVVTRHIWDGANIIADANEHGVFARYIRGIGLVAREQDNLLQYYLFNAHGDVIQRTDHYGGVLKSYDYDAFGVEKNPEKLDSNPFRFCGEYWDSDTETLYLRARYYDPAIGRFGAEDPINDGLNWYTYCGNNPLMFIDPSGLAATALEKLVKSTISKVVSFAKSVFSSNSSSSSKSSSSKSTAVTSNTSLQYKAAAVPKTGPGAQFSSADAAAKDFGKYIGQDSIENDREYGTYIYSWEETKEYTFNEKVYYTYKKTYYSYTAPHTDEKSHSVYMDKNPTVPKGVFVAGAHTHGAYSENADGENFSGPDEYYAKRAKNGEGVPLYLLTPSGFLYKFDPQMHKSGEKDEIANNMPYDLDVPNIQLTRKSNKSYTGKGYRKK